MFAQCLAHAMFLITLSCHFCYVEWTAGGESLPLSPLFLFFLLYSLGGTFVFFLYYLSAFSGLRFLILRPWGLLSRVSAKSNQGVGIAEMFQFCCMVSLDVNLHLPKPVSPSLTRRQLIACTSHGCSEDKKCVDVKSLM